MTGRHLYREGRDGWDKYRPEPNLRLNEFGFGFVPDDMTVELLIFNNLSNVKKHLWRMLMLHPEKLQWRWGESIDVESLTEEQARKAIDEINEELNI